MCERKFVVCLNEKKDDSMDVNHQVVSAVMSTGSGYNHLKTITASIDIPCISPAKYMTIHNKVCEWWEIAAAHSMAVAAKEEADYARLIGSVNADGVPLVAVALDGCWSKRSYGKNYSALSGAAAIVGLKTGKCLYYSVKNKYCLICTRSVNKSEQPPEHTCFMNYSGPSTGMESSIIVEGFKESLAQHGVIYHKFVADGDSSTYKRILESRPYGDLIVTKIECKNHLLRNFCNALVKLSQDISYPSEVRKILKERYLRLRSGIKCAITYWGSQNLSFAEKMNKIAKDITNSPQHVFGNHEHCGEYFCKPQSRRTDSPHIMSSMVATGLLQAVEIICKKLCNHANSLTHNVTSNLVESYNAQIAKHVGGKRINYSLRRSYSGRCAAAVVSFNTGTLHTTTHEIIFGSKPTTLIAKVENYRLNYVKKANPRRKQPRRLHITVSNDAHYGPNCAQPDMSPGMFEEAKATFLNELKLSTAECERLERSTVMQRASAEWKSRRRKLLTSSWFGEVCKKRLSTSCGSLVKRITSDSNLSSVPAVRYGIDNEEIAIRQLEQQENITVNNCGLFIDKNFQFLGTSPDGKYEDGIVEIKCPASLANFSLDDAMKKHAFWKLDKVSNNYIINKNHNWYYQIQGQLHITGHDICILGIWFGKDLPLKVYQIVRDDQFWKSKMEKQLIEFYNDCLLPELVDPRIPRSMEIRDPPYILTAMKEKSESAKRLIDGASTSNV